MSDTMAPSSLYTQFDHDSITDIVHQFYGKVVQDDHIGPVFDIRIDDWPTHLDRMVAFWTAVLCGQPTYFIHPRGTPPILHRAISELEVPHFETWLGLWYETAYELFEEPLAEEIVGRAVNIARNLSYHLRTDGTEAPRVPTSAP